MQGFVSVFVSSIGTPICDFSTVMFEVEVIHIYIPVRHRSLVPRIKNKESMGSSLQHVSDVALPRSWNKCEQERLQKLP